MRSTILHATQPSLRRFLFKLIVLMFPPLLSLPSFWFETGSHIVQAGLKLTIELNTSCLCLPRARILDMHHLTQLRCLLFYVSLNVSHLLSITIVSTFFYFVGCLFMLSNVFLKGKRIMFVNPICSFLYNLFLEVLPKPSINITFHCFPLEMLFML